MDYEQISGVFERLESRFGWKPIKEAGLTIGGCGTRVGRGRGGGANIQGEGAAPATPAAAVATVKAAAAAGSGNSCGSGRSAAICYVVGLVRPGILSWPVEESQPNWFGVHCFVTSNWVPTTRMPCRLFQDDPSI
jgi:hypothetical protein